MAAFVAAFNNLKQPFGGCYCERLRRSYIGSFYLFLFRHDLAVDAKLNYTN
jgi:hypothetical protein